MSHKALFIHNSNEEEILLHILKGNSFSLFPDLQGKKGFLFGTSVIDQYLREELDHDDYTLTEGVLMNGKPRSIATYSSGQQKLRLLAHLKNQNPDFILLDKPYDCLDVEAQISLEQELLKLSEEIVLIQNFKIRDEVLACIDTVCLIENNQIDFEGNKDSYDLHFHSKLKPFEFQGDLPKPLTEIVAENPLIKFTNVNIFYEETRQVVNNINWTIQKGEFWHLKGPNGSGKTSLLTMLTGDNPKAFGENITLFGHKKGSGESVWELKKKIGYFHPGLVQFFTKLFTVQHMVLSGYYDTIGLYQKPTGQQIVEGDKWLDLVGLKSKKQKYFTHLTKEQQRIVLIIRAMVKHPPLLILDEPTNELDDFSTSMLTAFIHKIHQETETTILYVSHRMLKGLSPDKVYQLVPTDAGSVGEEFSL